MVFASLGIVHFVSAPIDPGEFEQLQQRAGHRARRHAAEECEGGLVPPRRMKRLFHEDE